MFKKVISLFFVAFFSISLVAADEGIGISASIKNKLYVDEDDLDLAEDSFFIHIGENIWLETDMICRDVQGIFTYECHINSKITNQHMQYEKKWKCPYCHHYWPVGTPCQNPECPSKYK